MYDLKGKVALVTGAGGERGMGRAIATRLAREGADVIVNDIVPNPHVKPTSGWGGVPDVVREIEGIGRQAIGVLSDITDSTQVDDMVRQGLERFGHIDILMNNAAAPHGPDLKPVVELEEDAWDLMMRVNVTGTFLCCRAVARQMISRGEGGKIIITASTQGKLGMAKRAAYCASKFALVGFTQSLALELAPYRINVNAVCPGAVDTERIEQTLAALAPEGVSLEEYHTEHLRERDLQIPMGRVARPSDIANMVAFLSSSESDYLTGLSVLVAGGYQLD